MEKVFQIIYILKNPFWESDFFEDSCADYKSDIVFFSETNHLLKM